MNKSPWIFLGVIATLSLSWWGMVYGPAAQLGAQAPEMANGQPSAPTPLSGLAQQGEQVYRANGCYYCHTRAANGGEFGYLLQINELGPNRALTEEIIGADRMTPSINLAYHILSTLKESEAKTAWANVDANATATDELRAEANATLAQAVAELKVTDGSVKDEKFTTAQRVWAYQISGVATTNQLALGTAGITQADANGSTNVEGLDAKVRSVTAGTEQWADISTMVARLKNEGGAAYKLQLVAKEGAWADVEHHKARRQTVARDFFFNAHGLSGVMRLGPDLSNIGATMGSDEEMLLRLYNSRLVNKQTAKSAMPPYRFLFTSQPLAEGERLPAGAVKNNKGNTVRAGYAVMPTEKALALVAFLRSLRQESLPEAPLVTQ